MKPMNPTAWMQRRYRSVFLPTLKPRYTTTGPSGAGHECADMFREIGDCGLSGGDGGVVLELAFFDDFSNVFCEVLGDC